MTANGHHTVCLILKWALTIFIIIIIIINKQIIDATAFLTSSFLKIHFKTFLTQKRLFETHMAQNYYRPSLDGTDTFAKRIELRRFSKYPKQLFNKSHFFKR